MKMNYIMFVVFAIVLSTNANSQVINEGFEHAGSMPSNWTIGGIVTNSAEASWDIIQGVNPISNTGDYCVKFSGSGWKSIISSVIDISSYNNARLSFSYKIPVDLQDWFKVYYKTDGGDWTMIYSNYNAANWTNVDIALTHVSSLYQIAFEGIGNNSQGVFIDDIMVYNFSPAPDSTTCVYPLNTQIDVARNNNNLVWAKGNGFPTAYKLYFGTDGAGITNPTNIVSGIFSVIDTVYEYTNLLASTTYYWKVVPLNENGEATNCSIWSFTTDTNGLVDIFPYLENFDDSTDFPLNWTNIIGESEKDYEITNSSSWGVPGDHTTGTGNYLLADASTPNSIPVSISSPIFDLTELQNPILSFWYNLAAEGTGESMLYVDIYDGVNWNEGIITLDPDTNTSRWMHSEISIQNYISNATIIRFRTQLGFASNSDVKIDDFSIFENLECTNLIAPANNSDNIHDNGSLSWSAVERASSYKIYLGTDNLGISNPTDVYNAINVGNVLSETFSNLSLNTTYYWAVEALNEFGNVIDCDIFTFTTEIINSLDNNNISEISIINTGNQIVLNNISNCTSISLYTITGEILYNITLNENQKTLNIPCQAFSEGIYLVKLNGQNNSKSMKIKLSK